MKNGQEKSGQFFKEKYINMSFIMLFFLIYQNINFITFSSVICTVSNIIITTMEML